MLQNKTRSETLRLTEFNLPIGYDQVWRIGLIINIGGFVEKLEQTFGVNQRLVDRAIDEAEVIERAIDLEEGLVNQNATKHWLTNLS